PQGAFSISALAKFAPDDLAGGGQGQRIDITHLPGILMGGKSRAHMFLQFTCERFSRRESRFEYNECLDDLGALLIRRPYDRSHAHGGMAQQAVFDGSRPDAIARTGNDVVVAADERHVALRVLRAGIAGDEPVTD